MSRVVHFEIPVDDPDRAARFYTTVFGWSFEKFNGPVDYWSITTGPNAEPGINGGMGRRNPISDRLTDTVAVDSIEESIAMVERNGGRIVAPKMPIPGIGWLAYFADTEGNVFGMMQPDPNAR